MKLPEDDPEAFERLVQWLYSKTYQVSPFPFDPLDPDQTAFLELAALYVAADKYGIIPLKNDVIDRVLQILCRLLTTLSGSPTIDYIYENTTRGSKLRTLVVTIDVWAIKYDWYDSEGTRDFLYQQSEYAAELALQMAKRVNGAENPFPTHVSQFREDVVGQ